MTRMPTTIARLAVIAMAALASQADATLIAYDGFRSGTDPTAGEYAAGTSIATNVARTNFGFASTGYTSGTGTSQFVGSASASVSPSPVQTEGGRVFFAGAGSPFQARTVARSLAMAYNVAAGTSVYTSQILTRGANTTAAPLAGTFLGVGFGNAATPAPGVSYTGTNLATNAASLSGFYVGFAGTNGTTDFGSLVIRARTAATPVGQNTDTVIINGATTTTENQTYFVVTRVDSQAGADALTYWVNPTDLTSEATMTQTSAYTNASAPMSFFGPQGTGGDISRLTFADTSNAGAGGTGTGVFAGTGLFDEVRLGTTLAPILVPEPTTLAALAGVAAVAVRRRRK